LDHRRRATANGFHDTHSQSFRHFAARHGSAALAAPLDNKDGFWSEWNEATFERAAHEKKFVIVSLQSWWCPWCLTMNKETWADPEVRAELKDHFIPVHVDQDSRPDISQRYERWGWPATIIFGPDGTEIVKLRGFYSPKFFIPVLKETVKDPSPVVYGEPGGPGARAHPGDRPRPIPTQRHSRLHEQGLRPGQRGWSKSKLVDGPTLGWFLDRAKAGDAEAAERIKRTLTAMTALIDKDAAASARSPWRPTGRSLARIPDVRAAGGADGLCARSGAVQGSRLSRRGGPDLRIPEVQARGAGRRLLRLDGHGRGPARRRQAAVRARDRPGDPGPRGLL
jgi:hypothetical protein